MRKEGKTTVLFFHAKGEITSTQSALCRGEVEQVGHERCTRRDKPGDGKKGERRKHPSFERIGRRLRIGQ